MTCHQTQLQLSLYLYGELDFASEEAVEAHVAECAACQQALAREKMWHTTASSEQSDVPLTLLSDCRRELRQVLQGERDGRPAEKPAWRWPSFLQISPNRWSYQLAAASFLVFVGFYGGRFVDRMQPGSGFGVTGSNLVNTHVRDIQRSGNNQVRILLDQTAQRELVGSPQDGDIRRLLVIAAQNSGDASIRVDSVDVLSGQAGGEVRDMLLSRVQHDPNAAVRLKALQAVRQFASEPATRLVLRGVLEHDADASVRSAAIDVLMPANETIQLTPELIPTLQHLAQSERDEYVRMRCLQLLGDPNASNSVDTY